MTDDVLSLLTELQSVVEQETALLDSVDYAAAVQLLRPKQAMVTALQAALAENPADPADDTLKAALRERLAAVETAAKANQTALAHSLVVQNRLMNTIAAAIPRARADEAPIYRANGGKLPFRPPLPYAFLKQM